LAIGCGLVASIGITEVIARRNAEPIGPVGQNVPIFVAMTDIGLGEMLTSQMIELKQWPKDKVPRGAISKIENIEGRRTRTKLYTGELILENRLLGKGASEQGATALIPKGYRVVPVKVDLVSGGSSLILPGDRVDVMIHLVRDPGRDIQETVTRTILQDIKVFAVNDVVDLEKEKDGVGRSITAKTISLLVTPEQAAKVMLASQMGSVNLVMRSPEDDQQGPIAQARPSELLGTSHQAERDKESLVAPEKNLSDKAKDFVDFLDSTKKKPAATGSTPPSSQTWTMRMLKAGEIEDVHFESQAAHPSSDSPLGDWKKVAGAQANAAVVAPAAQEPAPAQETPATNPSPKPTGKRDRNMD
ncbi:MAG: Flp pilus assembly protein CpaB, partial [Thermoguttaceae bacterium]